MKDLDWQVEKMCTDYGEYELNIEKQKTDWTCEQKRESWKWSVSYHGSITSSGASASVEDAQNSAVANLPQN